MRGTSPKGINRIHPLPTFVSSFNQDAIHTICKGSDGKTTYVSDLRQNPEILRSKPASLSCTPGSPERNQNVRCSQCWAGRRTGVHTLSLQLPAYTSGSEGFVCCKLVLSRDKLVGKGTTVVYGISAPLESVQWPSPVRFSTMTSGKVIPLRTPKGLSAASWSSAGTSWCKRL